MSLLLKNGRVVDPATETDETLDILIDRGKFIEIKPRIQAQATKIIDVSRHVVAPGFIDMHTHLRDPGQEDKETIQTGSAAAAKGGFTSIACMPNTSPVNDHRGVTEYIISEARKRAMINVFSIAAVTKSQGGEQLTDMGDLAEAGAVAFSDDGFPVKTSEVMRRALEYAEQLGKLIIDHCEDKTLTQDGVMHEGYYSYMFGLRGMPASAEEIIVSRDLILAEKAEARIHIAHISVKGAVDLIREAKRKKVKVTVEVTPHHLLLNDSALENYDTNLKVNPPLRSQEDSEYLIEAVKDGTIDALVTDHAPHTMDDKEVEFDKAPFGINGLETAVSLLLDRLVSKNVISLTRFIQMISTSPAKILGLENKGQIVVGADADLTILNLNKEVIVDPEQFKSKSRNTPFRGWKLRGAPVMTVVGGRIVYSV